MKLARIFGTGLVDLLFPPRCYICGTDTEPGVDSDVCLFCREQVVPLRQPLCGRCGREFPSGATAKPCCDECLQHRPPFSQARSCFHYAPPISSLLQRLKFRGDTGAAALLGALVRQHDMQVDSRHYDKLVPVPLHARRLTQRGLNQSKLIAAHSCKASGRKIDTGILVRTRDTLSQTSLDGQARRENLHGAFALAPGCSVENLRICLVDDVYTTGTTVAECARILHQQGAASVDVWTVARA